MANLKTLISDCFENSYKTYDELRLQLIKKIENERKKATSKLDINNSNDIREASKLLGITNCISYSELDKETMEALLAQENSLQAIANTFLMPYNTPAETVQEDVENAVKRIKEREDKKDTKGEWQAAKKRVMEELSNAYEGYIVAATAGTEVSGTDFVETHTYDLAWVVLVKMFIEEVEKFDEDVLSINDMDAMIKELRYHDLIVLFRKEVMKYLPEMVEKTIKSLAAN